MCQRENLCSKYKSNGLEYDIIGVSKTEWSDKFTAYHICVKDPDTEKIKRLPLSREEYMEFLKHCPECFL